MKNNSLIWIVAALVVVAVVVGWFMLRPAPAPSPVKPAGVATPEAAPLPKVITLYQKGDGESDLAAFVSAELTKKYQRLAAFKLINVLDEPQMAEYYGVSSQPAVIFQLPSGRIFSKHEGYLSKQKILSTLKAMAKS